MSDSAVSKQTGRTWAEWVGVLDAARAAEKPHRQIAAYFASLGTPRWWSQMVTVGYERIRGLREKGSAEAEGMTRAGVARSTCRSRRSSPHSRMRARAACGYR
jgi:hypothetical protein